MSRYTTCNMLSNLRNKNSHKMSIRSKIKRNFSIVNQRFIIGTNTKFLLVLGYRNRKMRCSVIFKCPRQCGLQLYLVNRWSSQITLQNLWDTFRYFCSLNSNTYPWTLIRDFHRCRYTIYDKSVTKFPRTRVIDVVINWTSIGLTFHRAWNESR